MHAVSITRFASSERAILLRTGGLGELCIQRLEDAGIGSLDQLRLLGAEVVTEMICRHVGTTAWRNRRRPIERALRALDAARPASPNS
ncbi:helix-hairpin-helix domain-containing protein [Rubrivivax albus]|uniref:Helix-hairpin-helix domain-containing protein n=1 Tax=Rubrivivax albus TaxID=2499835 RepID=A0A437JV91_9BURK|nr:helix-hairpin-helix domain-containing protein [Rubrivivax albus]RVT51304.1 helix-hairpin-helix domain-containing protein [Rubrivivax albus]